MSISEIIRVIGELAALIGIVLTFWQAKRTHLAVNSRMTELLKLTQQSSHAEGVKDEQNRQV